MSREDHINMSVSDIDERLVKQPMWVKEIINDKLNKIGNQQSIIEKFKRKSKDADGRVVRGYELAGAGEILPSNDTYFFRIGERREEVISVRLEEGRLYMSGGVDSLVIQPQAYNAFYIFGRKDYGGKA